MKTKIKKIIIKLNLINILSVFFYIFRIFPIKNKKIVFVNFSGKGYGDNPKYILEYLNKNNSDLDFVWLVNNTNDKNFPSNVRKVKIFSMKSFFELATAKVWVNNSRFDQFVVKRKKQFYIQTWHGGLALKKIEYDAYDKMSEYYKKVMKKDNMRIDLMLSNSKFCTKMYKRGFKYTGELLEAGSPRNDILINKNNGVGKKIREVYKVSRDEKILLYAPTFRNNYDTNPYDINFLELKKILEKVTNYKWKIFIRLHPRINNASDYIASINSYTDVTNYNDIQELICASDMLITDYSSTMFEAMIANKPVILYANDIENYNEERGTYFEFEELPFPLAKNNKDLLNIINNLKTNIITKKYDDFKDMVGLAETGKSCEIVSDIILSKTKEKE